MRLLWPPQHAECQESAIPLPKKNRYTYDRALSGYPYLDTFMNHFDTYKLSFFVREKLSTRDLAFQATQQNFQYNNSAGPSHLDEWPQTKGSFFMS